MLKHKDIIDKLTAEQKVALLTDTREVLDERVAAMNIPSISLGELFAENVFGEREALFPSAKSLANSWDEALFGDVARCLAHMGAKRGDNLFLLPSSNAASSAYGKEISEEPCLSGKLVAGMARKLKEFGIPYCLSAPVCTAENARYLDDEADFGVAFDRIARPFRMVERVGGASAVLLSNEVVDGSYKEANDAVFAAVVPDSMEQMVKIEDGDMTSSALNSGKQLIGGSSLVVSTALENYKRIYRSMQEGGATAQELQMTMADGAAISEDLIDEALDKKLSLASVCARGFVPVADEDIKNFAYTAASESIVLVKNEKALPLGKKEKLCIIGDIINDGDECGYKSFGKRLAQAMGGANVVGSEKGYLLSENVSADMIEPACKVASTATTAIVFVGLGTTRENRLNDTARLSLPGNQIALITKLRSQVKKLVVVICGQRLPDMSFDHLADAILLVPSEGAFVADALWDIMSGKECPCGKLAYAGYRGGDTSFREVQKRKKLGLQKIGPFVAYRYADSNNEDVPYPVGFGLSYTSFTYSKLRIDKTGKLTFTVKNTGKVEGCEIVQVYMNKRESAIIRPGKELKGAVKVRLRAGKKTTVSIPVAELDVYDENTSSFAIEKGVYNVYIGSNAVDIKLTGKVSVGGVELNKKDKRLSDYLQNVSNITSESYTMEAYCKPMNIKSKLKNFGAVLLIAILFADVIYAICCFMERIDFNKFLIPFIIVNGVFFLLGFIFMLVGGAKVRKLKKKMEKLETEATKELFKAAKPTDVKAIDELFADEFDVSLEGEVVEEITVNDKDASTYAYMAVDTDIPTLCKELEAHFAEYGLAISSKMARRILSAVMTSRLLVVRTAVAGASTNKIVEILARFFGTEPHFESLNGEKWQRKSLLRYNKADGESLAKPAPLSPAISTAFNEGDKACFFGISDVQLSDLGEMLMPYVQYFGNPEVEHTVADETGSVVIPSNLWFVVGPAKNQSLDDVPAFIANLATLIDVEAQSVQEASTKTVRKYNTCHQLEALIFRAKKAAVINEEIWKGVDALESFVSEKTSYHIGNKLFLQLEKYIAIYNTCEEDLHEALDCAIAGKLLTGMLNLLKNADVKDVDLAQYAESVLGEEYSISCRNTIKRLVLNRATVEAVNSNETNAAGTSGYQGIGHTGAEMNGGVNIEAEVEALETNGAGTSGYQGIGHTGAEMNGGVNIEAEVEAFEAFEANETNGADASGYPGIGPVGMEINTYDSGELDTESELEQLTNENGVKENKAVENAVVDNSGLSNNAESNVGENATDNLEDYFAGMGEFMTGTIDVVKPEDGNNAN